MLRESRDGAAALSTSGSGGVGAGSGGQVAAGSVRDVQLQQAAVQRLVVQRGAGIVRRPFSLVSHSQLSPSQLPRGLDRETC